MVDILGTGSGEKDLAAKLQEYQALAQANPDKKIDVAALMMSAMENQQRARVSTKARNWSYTLSTLLPPVGLFIAAYYWWWSDKEDAHNIALVCVGLTVFIIAVTLIFFDVLIQSVATPSQIQGIENINVQQVQQELQ
jgi:hypothetical protein